MPYPLLVANALVHTNTHKAHRLVQSHTRRIGDSYAGERLVVAQVTKLRQQRRVQKTPIVASTFISPEVHRAVDRPAIRGTLPMHGRVGVFDQRPIAVGNQPRQLGSGPHPGQDFPRIRRNFLKRHRRLIDVRTIDVGDRVSILGRSVTNTDGHHRTVVPCPHRREDVAFRSPPADGSDA